MPKQRGSSRAEKISGQLRAARAYKGLSQNQMDKLIGHKRGVYGTWERNPDKITLGNLRIVCKALEIDIGELVKTT